MMESAIPLLVALVGAAVGAYFAVIKSQKERLWLDRYETLRDVVLAAGTVESSFSSSYMEQLGVSVMGIAESKRLQDEWPVAMHGLRQHMAKLRLLFKDGDISEVREKMIAVHSAFQDMYNGEHMHQPELHEAVGMRASELSEAAVRVAQRHCL
jgi:hypothetical protein